MTIWRMRIACWIPKATKTHSECVTLIALQVQQWLHERASMLRYTYIECIVYFYDVIRSPDTSGQVNSFTPIGKVSKHRFPRNSQISAVFCADFFLTRNDTQIG